jgi:hypothetical protein
MGVDPTVVSPAAASITKSQPHIHIEIEPSLRIDLFPNQRRQRRVVLGCELALPMRLAHQFLVHQCIHVDHAILNGMLRHHVDLVVVSATRSAPSLVWYPICHLTC